MLDRVACSDSVTRWHLGNPGWDPVTGDAIVALSLARLSAASVPVLGMHEVVELGAVVPRAPEVHVWFPAYRGKSLVGLLGWLVTEHLAEPDARVVWHFGPRQGDRSIQRSLISVGWQLVEAQRGAKSIEVTLRPPAVAPELEVPRFVEDSLVFEAGFGVFSPTRIDDGTRLLIEACGSVPAVDTVVDIGIGYGAVALSLVRGGVAQRAVGSDIDAIALWLAGRNAAANGVQLTRCFTADPTALPGSGLTVSNVPTHIDRQATDDFVNGLLRRSSNRLLVVVHTTIVERYFTRLAVTGEVRSVTGAAHTVLDVQVR